MVLVAKQMTRDGVSLPGTYEPGKHVKHKAHLNSMSRHVLKGASDPSAVQWHYP